MHRARGIILSFLVAASVCHAADLVRLPYLQNVGPSYATVLWTSKDRGVGIVQYSAEGDLSGSVPAQIREFPRTSSSAGFFQYQAEIRGLIAGREYLYQVVMDGEAAVSGLRFRTTGAGAFTFLALGDSGTGNEAQQAIARRMIDNEDPSFLLHTGDLSQESGTFDQLDAKYFGVYRELMNRTPFFPSPGNHDYYTDGGMPYLSSQALPAGDEPSADQGRYYSFNWGNAHFVSLNSNLLDSAGPAAGRMLAWLEGDLQRQTKFWKVVYFHHAPYATGHHLNDPLCVAARERVVPILEKYNVQLVLSGHEHSYQRTVPLRNGVPAGDDGGTVYVITGGGGGILHHISRTPITAVGESVHHYLRGEVRGATLTLTAIDAKGEIVDKVTLTRPTQVAVESVVNLGSYTPGVAAGSLVSISGRALAAAERSAPGLPSAEPLGGVRVTWNRVPAPLLSVSPYQIKAQLPFGISGKGMLHVVNQSGEDDFDLEVAAAAPAIVTIPVGLRLAPAITESLSGDLVTFGSPALPGSYIAIFAVGLGDVRGNLAGNREVPAGLNFGAGPVTVQIGKTTVAPDFAGLIPGYAGLYQINVRIPEGTRVGPLGLRIRVGDAASEPATLFVGRSPG